jgi:hypothetical protein
VVFLVFLVMAIAVVVLVMRAAEKSAGVDGPGSGTPRPQRRPKPPRAARPLAPDDDPEFLRELERRAKRDDGSPA